MSPAKSEMWTDTLKFALVALLIVIPVRWFIAQPFIVRGESMYPTFENNEYLIVDQLTYHFQAPQRGDVIIMRYPKDTKTFFIKRIIGLPNDTVEIQGKTVSIQHGADKKSFTLDESFIAPERMQDQYKVYTLGSDEYFVMGDNRVASSDSRFWGNLPRQDVVGRAYLRLWPFSRINVLPGKVTFPQ